MPNSIKNIYDIYKLLAGYFSKKKKKKTKKNPKEVSRKGNRRFNRCFSERKHVF